MKRTWLKRLAVGSAIVFVLLIIAALGVRSMLRGVSKGKSVHDLRATVMGKEHLHFDERNHSYIDDVNFTYYEPAHRVEYKPGDDEWRVYYRITSLDPMDEPNSTRVLQLEQKRVANGKNRFTILSKPEFDRLNAGDNLSLKYQRFSDDELMIW
jgi:hypothetical protein